MRNEAVVKDEVKAKVKATRGKFHLESYGCQMNLYDSGLVASILKNEGYQPTDSVEEAEILLLNTCSIREKAYERVYGRIESLAHLRRKNPHTIIGVLGCMAQSLGKEFFSSGLPIDFTAGPDNYRLLPDLIESASSNREQSQTGLSLLHLSRSETYDELRPSVVTGCTSFVTIMRGCDNFCSFCVVPYTRGRERSRSPYSIVDEISSLPNVSEVTLLGQNVNSYCWKENFHFHDLVELILKETDIQRIRFTSPHPKDFPEELLDLMAREKRFCKQIHLPLQSGSSSVLRRMKRGYTQEEYLSLVELIRSKMPFVGLSSDIITGFCGETEEDFQDTLSVVEQVGFDTAYMFRYSERKNTSAAKYLKDDVPEDVKLIRLQQLIQEQQKMSALKNRLVKGKKFEVLVEGYSRRSQSSMTGRTDSGKTVVFPLEEGHQPEDLTGKLVQVEIEGSTSATLHGRELTTCLKIT